MEISTFQLEKKIFNQNNEAVIGIDEAGRGPLAGPVVAAAVLLKNSSFLNTSIDSSEGAIKEWNLVRDSKTLSNKQREKIFDFIHENFYVGMGICDSETIDKINILEASFLAMKKAFQDLKRNALGLEASFGEIFDNSCVLVDGNKKIPNFSKKQMAIIEGDKTVKSISAASIIAKVVRDRIMLAYHEKYPHYGFDNHKGYGTKVHMSMLEKYGFCNIHRKSFGPVKRLVKRLK